MNPQTSGTYHMNNIPRGTSPEALLRSLAQHWRVHDAPLIYGLVLQTLVREPIIHDSKLDDGLSVTTLEFKDTPKWFKELDRDPDGFPKKSRLGMLWRGVDMTSLDADRRNEFTTAVIAGDLLYAETLAEFEETDVNSQDNAGRTALHWACAANNIEMASFCLSVPGIDIGLKDSDGLTAFDISCNHEDKQEIIPRLFYHDMFEMEKNDPDDALLRMLTMSSEPDLDGPVFPAKALLRPVIRNNLPLVAALMETGVQLTAVNEAQETALHLAAKEGHKDMIEFLLGNSSRGGSFDVDAVTEDQLTPLHYAAANGHVEVLQALLGHGADKAVPDILGRTALDLAIENTHTAIKAILDRKGKEYDNEGMEIDLVEQRGLPELPTLFQHPEEYIVASGATAFTDIFSAAASGDEELVNKLLDQGANIEARDWAGSTALLNAVSCDQLKMVLMLLNRGADIKTTNSEIGTVLHLAATHGSDETIKLLLDRGANIQTQNLAGSTALHLAAVRGVDGPIKLLLDRGADINARDGTWTTALHDAVASTSYESVKLLLDRGANIQAQNLAGSTALHLAAVRGVDGPIKLLLDRGADINARDGTWKTALHNAVASANYESVKLLLDRGADINAKDRVRATALHLAGGHATIEVVELLLDRGANINTRDYRGETALEYARKFDNQKTQLALEKNRTAIARSKV